MKQFPDLPVCITGGAGLNVLVNEEMKRRYDREIYIPPNPNDCGLSVGNLFLYTRPSKSVDVTYNGLPLLDRDKLDEYVVEREVIINSVEEGDAILKLLGCKVNYKIEKIREIYQLKGCKEIVFDSYAGLPTYIEIDCHNLSSLKNISKLLGYTIDDHDKRKIPDLYYELYGIPKNAKWGDDVTIKKAKKIFTPLIKKNKKNFMDILKKQMKLVK